MKKICLLLLIMTIVLSGCVYDGLKSLYGDEWIDEHTTKIGSDDASSDNGGANRTPIININDDETNDDNTSNQSGDTTTTTIQYTISFNANGGIVTMDDITMRNGEEKTLLRCTFTPPVGMKFSCWKATANNYASFYSDCAVVKDLLSENGAVVTLSAQWIDKPQHSISYYNTLNAYNPNSTTFSESKAVALQDLSLVGYDFNGWNDAVTGNKIIGWEAGERTTNVTLGADWTPHNYTIIYYGNGGTGHTEKQVMTYGMSVALRENGFNWVGYEFIGWNTDYSKDETDYNDGQIVSNLTAEDGGIIELYAMWREKKWYVSDDGVECSCADIIANDNSFPADYSTIIITDKVPDLTVLRTALMKSKKNISLILDRCTGLTEIGYSAFRGCSYLQSIILPNSITLIEKAAFYDCVNLTKVIITTKIIPRLNSGDYANPFPHKATLSIYVLTELVYDYKHTSYWRDYSDRIYPIEE